MRREIKIVKKLNKRIVNLEMCRVTAEKHELVRYKMELSEKLMQVPSVLYSRLPHRRETAKTECRD